MAVANTVEIISSSTESIEAAVRFGVAKAAETINGIEGAWVKGDHGNHPNHPRQ